MTKVAILIKAHRLLRPLRIRHVHLSHMQLRKNSIQCTQKSFSKIHIAPIPRKWVGWSKIKKQLYQLLHTISMEKRKHRWLLTSQSSQIIKKKIITRIHGSWINLLVWGRSIKSICVRWTIVSKTLLLTTE